MNPKVYVANLHGQINKLMDENEEMMIERNQLRAELAGLRTGYQAYERVNAEMKAEVEGLRDVLGIDPRHHVGKATIEGLKDSQDQLKAENESLRKDAERYRWLSDQAELESHGGSDYCLPTVHAWDYKPGPQLNEKFESLDDAIDAAMGQGERS